MKNWRLCFFLLALGVFSQATWCSETPEQAITRIYHSPQDSMKIQLFKPHDRWLLTDVDNLDDPLPSLMWQRRDDTQSKLLLAPQLATNSHKVEDVAISELLANPDKYHQKKYAYGVTLF